MRSESLKKNIKGGWCHVWGFPCMKRDHHDDDDDDDDDGMLVLVVVGFRAYDVGVDMLRKCSC